MNGTVPLGEYLIGRSVELAVALLFTCIFHGFSFLLNLLYSHISTRDGGAHGRYGAEDWTFMKCRQHMTVVSATLSSMLVITKCFDKFLFSCNNRHG